MKPVTRLGLFAVGWCAVIAATSHTVVLPHDLFAFLGEHVFRSEASLSRFVVFWGVVWFIVVKGWHLAEFAILFTLVFATLNRASPSAWLRSCVLAASFSVLFAISDEYHQTFVPGRGGNWRDVAIDTVGVGVGLLVVCSRRARSTRSP